MLIIDNYLETECLTATCQTELV